MVSNRALKQQIKNPVRDLLNKAFSLHSAGMIEKAQRIYKSILKKHPSNADAIHLLGVTYRQTGFPKRAVELIEKAIRIKPDQAPFYANLARAQQDLPGMTPEDVIATADKAVSLDPRQLEPIVIKAQMLWRLDQKEDADKEFQQLLAANPTYKEGRKTYAIFLLKCRQFMDALPEFEKLCELDPSESVGHVGRVWCKLELDELDHMELELFGALAQFPGNGELLWKAGEYLLKVRRFDEALTYAKQAVQDDPKCTHRRVILGLCELMTGQPQKATETLRLAEKLSPEKDHSIDWNLSLASLAAGDFETGWRLHEARFKCKQINGTVAKRDLLVPDWQGEDISDKTIMVWTDQGIGDVITSGILLHDLKELAGRIIFEGPVKTLGIFRNTFPGIICRPPTTFENKPEGPDYDCAICITDLGRYFRKTPADFNRTTRPAFTFDREKARGFLDRLGDRANGPIIGVSWRSKNLSSSRREVYLSAPDFSPVMEFDGVTYVNLQYISIEKELAFMDDITNGKFVNFSDVDLFNDLGSALSLSAICDLVISANTAAAILPGVLDIPVFSWGGYYQIPLLEGKFIPPLPSIYHYQINSKLPTTQVIPYLKEEVGKCLENFSPDARNTRLGL